MWCAVYMVLCVCAVLCVCVVFVLVQVVCCVCGTRTCVIYVSCFVVYVV